MFVLGNLEIRILNMLTEKPISPFWLYENLTKQGVQELAFENAIKSLERKKLICTESLRLQLNENGKMMLAVLQELSPQKRLKVAP